RSIDARWPRSCCCRSGSPATARSTVGCRNGNGSSRSPRASCCRRTSPRGSLRCRSRPSRRVPYSSRRCPSGWRRSAGSSANDRRAARGTGRGDDPRVGDLGRGPRARDPGRWGDRPRRGLSRDRRRDASGRRGGGRVASRTMPDPPRFVTVDDYEALAREVLPPAISEFVAGGAGDERTLASNRHAFDRWVLRPRFLRGVAAADPSTELFGCPLALPVLIAPWAYQRTAHPDGELATARAAARAGTVFCASTTAEAILEDIAAASTSPKWWQLYVFADRGFTAE